ncbi:RHS repeat-associated core domain-containing protein [Winogradskya humida]|uniref:alpha-amylase n=1 Tax=Winogradskya humida TaxID=113566 RepID=A0ABQ4A6M9_9ACTN|nr:RHS repeat-associated core domain-containing protein [Actinoplanes humidus]GIE26517.1 hypothetical protein Ahu01nite_096190 [Actinoplanes humidus]
MPARRSVFTTTAAAILIAAQFTLSAPAHADPPEQVPQRVPQAAPAGVRQGPVQTAAATAQPVDLSYDGAGQVRGIAQVPSGAGAKYTYDDAGNITDVNRSAAGALTVAALNPSRAATGAKVTVGGTGFATTTGANTVTFNGTTATVTAATATRLTVTVPSGATTGTVTVATAAGTATSSQTFTVLASVPAPAVTGFTPAAGAADTTVTVTGTGFSTVPAENNVSFGRTRAKVSAATATSLTVKVPYAAVSGKITVGTPGGTAVSSGEFVAVTNPFGSGDVGPAAALALDGTASSVSVATAAKVAVLRFAGTKGQRLSFGVTGSTLGDVNIYAYTPYGGSIAHNEYDSPWAASSLAGGLALPPLPTSGTYQIVVQPVSKTVTGSFTATLSTRATGVLSLTGTGTTVALNRAGKQAELTFTAEANQRVSLGFTAATMTSSQLTAAVFEPNGTPVLWGSGSARTAVGLPGGNLDFTTSFAGTYTLILGTGDLATGSITVTVSAPVAVGALTLGTGKAVTIARPGQDAIATFAGTQGQALSLTFDSYTPQYSPYLTVTSPDGTVLSAGLISDNWVDLPALPATGTYTLTISPYSSTGSFTLTVLPRASAGTLTTTGAGTTATFTSSVRALDLSFAGTAAQPLIFAFSSWTLPSTATLRVRISDSAGTLKVDGPVSSLDTFRFTPATTGTYRVSLAPSGTTTGSVLVTLSTFLSGGALAINTLKTTTAPRPGQATTTTFTGTANQRLSLYVTSYTYSYVVWATLTKPDGTTLFSGWVTETWLAFAQLPAAGTYTLTIEPQAETGTFAFYPVEGVDGGATAIDGANKTLTAASAGRYIDTTIAVTTANQRLSLGFSGWTFTSTTLIVRLTDPSGNKVIYTTVSKTGSLDTRPLATTGTYRLTVMASDRGAGAVALTLSNQKNGSTLALNTAKVFSTDRIGQSTYVTYTGTAGQLLSMTWSSVTMTYYPYIDIFLNGTEVAFVAGSAATVTIPALPSAGTYEFVVGPYSASGSATGTLKTRTALAATTAGTAAPPRPDSAPLAIKQIIPAAKHRTLSKPATRKAPKSPVAYAEAPAASSAETWTPTRRNLDGQGWDTGRAFPKSAPASPKAPAGVTALSGRILTLDDKPLANVTVTVEGVTGRSDAGGQFLLQGLKPGHRVLRVDGATASSAGRTFGLHDIGVDVDAGRTTVLPYTIWLSKLDTGHTVKFASPTAKEVTIATPDIPGLEVKLPAGTVVRDVNGKVVTELGITAIPVDRTPFPLPRSQVPSYFTVQPGSSYVFPEGARVIYPNFTHDAPGARMNFWHYDPAGKGWFVYGKGKVTGDGKRVEPDKGTEVYQFTGAMLITPDTFAPPASYPQGSGERGADPVDLASGLLVDEETDLAAADVLPIDLTRTYQQSDTGNRAFGIGTNFTYGLDLYSTNRFYDCWLILPDGGRIRFHRISAGGAPPNGYLNSVLVADATPTAFNGSVLAWNGDGWDLKLRTGLTYVFGDEAPLQAIRDNFGNTVTITRDVAPPATGDGIVHANGPIRQITSPNGRWIRLTYNSDTDTSITWQHRHVVKAEDALGNATTYGYTGDYLTTVTDLNNHTKTYAYESGRLKTITNARTNVLLSNEYDASGRVHKQTLPGNAVYTIDYATDGTNRVTTLTDPRGKVRRVVFNAAGYSISDTSAYGTASAQVTTVTRDATYNRVTAVTDALNRRTELGYDDYGNVRTVTELAGTTDARTTTVERNGPYDQATKVTDPLQHATLLGYQADGALHTITDPLNRVTTLDTDESGQTTQITDPATKLTRIGYALGDAVSVTDPLGNVTASFSDAAGAVRRQTDAQGNITTVEYGPTGLVSSVKDAIGRTTGFTYDASDELHTVTDAKQHTTTYDYDTSNRLSKITDPLNRITSFAYDANGNLATATSARGKQTTYRYDDLDRVDVIRYGVTSDTAQESTATFTYDAGNRTRTVADSAAGTTTVTPDIFDRTISVADPSGTVGYTYDAADRRTTMAVAGQADTVYSYNNADQLTGVARGTETAAIGYDTAGRRASVTLPAGVSQTYGYDDASRLTSIAYARGTSTLGALMYTLDELGRPIHQDGSYGRMNLPAEYGPVGYDAADQLTGLTYDDDGNLASDGTTTYAWNARNQLTGWTKSGLSVNYGYDGLGRRSSKTSGSTTTGYLYDGLNAVQEKNGSSVAATLLSGGRDEVFSRTTPAGSKSLMTDALGSTIGLSDSSSVGAEYTYDPFGTSTVTGDDGGNPTQFTGRENDGSGLYYYRSRYYSTSQQRFISKDPLGLAGGSTDPYTYVLNQPTGLTDPMGLNPEGCNSFTAGTQVLMADGTSKAIDKIKPGDTVMAADPFAADASSGTTTGDRTPRKVSATITGHGDKELVTVTTADGGSVTATDGHPFWTDNDGRAGTPDGHWVDAKDLRRGDWLKSADGRLVKVAGIHTLARHAYAYNLTVDDLHTYYVLAGSTPVLVHNCNEDLYDHDGSTRYGALDDQGRATFASTVLRPDAISKGTAASRDWEPPGWSGNGTKFNEARGHLLGNKLGGLGSGQTKYQNIATIQQKPMNSPYMRDKIEKMIYDHVNANKETVQYTVTAIYGPGKTAPLGLEVAAYGNKGFNLSLVIINPGGI